MPEDEVEIEPDEEEYEVVPLSPIRKLEKRIDELEEKKDIGDTQALVNEVMDLVKSNQKMVEEVVKSNDELRRELQKIPDKVDEVLSQWEEFLEMLKKSEERSPASADLGISGDMSDKLDKLIEQNSELVDKNEELVDSIKSLRRSMRGSSSSSTRSSRKSPKLRIKKESGE